MISLYLVCESVEGKQCRTGHPSLQANDKGKCKKTTRHYNYELDPGHWCHQRLVEAARKHKAQPGGSARNQPCTAPPTGTITLKKLRWKHLPNPSTYLGPTPKMGGEGTKLANY